MGGEGADGVAAHEDFMSYFGAYAAEGDESGRVGGIEVDELGFDGNVGFQHLVLCGGEGVEGFEVLFAVEAFAFGAPFHEVADGDGAQAEAAQGGAVDGVGVEGCLNH